MNLKLRIFEIYPKEILKNNNIQLEIINNNIKSKFKYNINEYIYNNKFINTKINESKIYFYLYINNNFFGKEEFSITKGTKWICIKNIKNSYVLNKESNKNFNNEIKLKISCSYIKNKFKSLNSLQNKNKEKENIYLSSRNSTKRLSRNKIFNKKLLIKNLSFSNLYNKRKKLFLTNELNKNNKNLSQKNLPNHKKILNNLSNNNKLYNKNSNIINPSIQFNSNDLNNNILLNSIITLTNESSDKENNEYIQLNTSNLNIKKIILKSSYFKNNINFDNNNSNENFNYINDKNDNLFEFNNLIKEFNRIYPLDYNKIEENKISIQFKNFLKNIIEIFLNYFKEYNYLKKQNKISINIIKNFSDKIKEIIKLKYKLDIYKEKEKKINNKNIIKLSYKENYNLKNINYSLNIMKKIINFNKNYLNNTKFNDSKEKNFILIEIIKKIYTNSENKKFFNEEQKNFIENKIIKNFEKIEVNKSNHNNFNNYNTNNLKRKLNFNEKNDIRKNLINSFEKIKIFENNFLPIKQNNIILKLKKLNNNKFYQSLNVSLSNYNISKYETNKK